MQRQIECTWVRVREQINKCLKSRWHRSRVRTDVLCTQYDMVVWFRYIEIEIVGACVLQSCNCRMLNNAFAAVEGPMYFECLGSTETHKDLKRWKKCGQGRCGEVAFLRGNFRWTRTYWFRHVWHSSCGTQVGFNRKMPEPFANLNELNQDI